MRTHAVPEKHFPNEERFSGLNRHIEKRYPAGQSGHGDSRGEQNGGSYCERDGRAD
jgi:hypothetical protein